MAPIHPRTEKRVEASMRIRLHTSKRRRKQASLRQRRPAAAGRGSAPKRHISIGRDGVVRRESSGIRLLAASNAAEENAEDLSMYKSDVTFDAKRESRPRMTIHKVYAIIALSAPQPAPHREGNREMAAGDGSAALFCSLPSIHQCSEGG